MKYEDVPAMTKEQAEKALASGVSQDIVRALLGATYHEPDWKWVQDRCLGFLDSSSSEIRDTAIACLGHLARIHGHIEKKKVVAALSKKLGDPQTAGRAEDALDDIEMFTPTETD